MSSADETGETSVDLKTQDAFPIGNIACNALKTEVLVSTESERSKANPVNGEPENREHENLEEELDVSDDRPALPQESFGSQGSQIKKGDCSTSGDLGFLVINHEPQNIPASHSNCTFATKPLNGEGIITSEKGKLGVDIPERLKSESCTSESDRHVQVTEVSNLNLDPRIEGSKNHLANQWTSTDKKSEIRTESSESPCSEASASSSVTSCTEDSGICSTVRDEELDEIPLGNTAGFSPEALKKMSDVCINDCANNWHPQTSNTYAPGTSQNRANTEVQDDQNMTGKPQKQKKLISLFSRTSNQESNSVGWKLFGKLPPKDDGKKSVKVLPKEDPFIRGSMHRNSDGSKSSSTGTKSKFLSLKRTPSAVASSTTALILENRPSNLPAKSASEEKKHRRLYESMVADAKKKELRDMKLNEKKLKEKCKQEDGIVNAVSIWANEILPNFETMRHSRRARDLWWQGLPPSVRGKVWKLAIGNELHITHELFDIFQSHAYEKLLVTRNNKKKQKETGEVAELFVSEHQQVFSRAHTVELIVLDVSRTFPSLCIFQEGGPYHDTLHSILGAYTCYRPDMGYVQGMSFLAAVLLLNMDPPDAFICFANLLNKPCQMAFFRVDHPMMKAYFAAFDTFLEEFLPRIRAHFTEENFTPDMYLIDWFFTLFTKCLPLDVACRIWDVFCRDGDDFLFKTALGILKIYQEELLCMDFVRLGQFLTKLPDNLSVSNFFQAIASFNFPRQKFDQILAQQIEIAAQIKSVASTTK